MTASARRAAPAALAAALLLAGCGTDGPGETLSSLNPFKEEEQRLPGERRSVLPGTDPAAAVAGAVASLGPAAARSDWPQPGGGPTNDPGNIAGNLTGARAWSVRAGRSEGGSFGLGGGAQLRVSARPVSAGGLVYVYDPLGNVSAHALSNGGAAWSVNLQPAGEREAVSGGGVAVDGGRVFVATGFGEIHALDARSGGKVWTTRLDAPARGAPTAAGGKVFVTTQSGDVAAFDAATGGKLWSEGTGGSGAGLLGSASPAVSGALVVVPTSTGEVLAFDVATGDRKWGASVVGGSSSSALTRLQDASASPVVHDGVVYATGVAGRAIAVSAANGEQIWSQPIGSAHTPVVSGGSLFMVDLSDRLLAFDRARGTALWATQLPAVGGKAKRSAWAGPVLVGGRLWLVSASGGIISVDAATGTAGGPGTIGIEGAIAPIAAGGRLVALGADGTLVALN